MVHALLVLIFVTEKRGMRSVYMRQLYGSDNLRNHYQGINAFIPVLHVDS